MEDSWGEVREFYLVEQWDCSLCCLILNDLSGDGKWLPLRVPFWIKLFISLVWQLLLEQPEFYKFSPLTFWYGIWILSVLIFLNSRWFWPHIGLSEKGKDYWYQESVVVPGSFKFSKSRSWEWAQLPILPSSGTDPIFLAYVGHHKRSWFCSVLGSSSER